MQEENSPTALLGWPWTRPLLVLLAAMGAIDWVWMQHTSIFGFVAVHIIAVLGLTKALGPTSRQAWSAPSEDMPGLNERDPDKTISLAPARILLGLILTAWAFYCAMTGQQVWIPVILLVVAESISFLPLLPANPSWAMGAVKQGAILFCIMLVAGWFRFYKAGDIPAGLITVDEPRIMASTHAILMGAPGDGTIIPAEGAFPFYVQDIGTRIFGDSILGGRMGSLLSGLFMVGLFALSGRELGGPLLGLVAAAFCALAQWPVTFSRAEYLMAPSYLPVLGFVWLSFYGLRRASTWALVLAGCCLGWSLNVYQAGKMTLGLPIFIFALWGILQPSWRRPLLKAAYPLGLGAILGLTPLLLWFATDTKTAMHLYFEPLYNPVLSSSQVISTTGIVPKLVQAFSQIPPQLAKVTTMFTINGGMRSWFFIQNHPVIDHVTLALFLLGLAACLAHPRKPLAIFLLAWWFLGLLPTMLGNPSYSMDERRIMMSLPPTFLIASMGLLSLSSIGAAVLPAMAKPRWAMSALLLFFVFYGGLQWKAYFQDFARDPQWLALNHANFDNMLRAIFKEDAKAPVYIISTRMPNDDNWDGSNPLNELGEHFSILRHRPYFLMSEFPAELSGGGLFYALRQRPAPEDPKAPPYDPLIVLTPFYYYLEPMLVSQLGGVRVEDVPPVISSDGIDYTDEGMLHDSASATRLIRLENFNPARLNGLEARWLYPYTVEELTPPAELGTRDSLSQVGIYEPKILKALESYDQNPGPWRAGAKADFATAEPWFWNTANNFPNNVVMPLRLKASFTLKIPSDGLYALGASATVYTIIKLDNKRVFTFIPEKHEQDPSEEEGILGDPLFLKAGDHKLYVEQVSLSRFGNFDHLIRLVWKTPSVDKETLPLEVLYPSPAKP